MNEVAYDRLIRALYGVALAPAGWAEPLRLLAGGLSAHNFHLMVWPAESEHPTYSFTEGMDERMESAYQAHYGAIDPRRLLVAEMDEGDWLACHHRFSASTVARSEFWQDYLIPGGLRYLLGSRLTRCDGADVFFGVHRAPDRPAFDDEDLARMRRVTPHFQEAARLWLSTEQLRTRALLGQQALDAIEHGVLLLDEHARVLLANRFAEALLKEGTVLNVRAGALTATAFASAPALKAALSQCLQTGQSRSVRLPDPSGEPADGWAVTVMSPPEDSPLNRGARAALLVLVTPGRHRRLLSVRQLMQLFGLTPAEARLARALAAGDTLEAFSLASGVRMPTVRTQLRAIFDKSGAQRQADLVRRIVVIPAVRDRSI